VFRIGIDVGGTFTDFTLLNEEDGSVHFHKVASTPHDPSAAIEHGISELLQTYKIAPEDIGHIGHGTTVATNLIIERRGALTGLITTKGFRDVIEIGRQVRPHLFDYTVVKPPPLAARQHRIEVSERIAANGDVVTALDEREVESAAARLKAARIQSVAICFLHAYRNPSHEQAARRIIDRVMPDAYVSVSSEVLPEFREYERWATTLLNAAVGPRMETYLESFLARVKKIGIGVEPFTIHSNGGLMSVRAVLDFPVRTCLSGPAAGVVGAAAIGCAAGFNHLVTFDVGGTSTDVSMIFNGKPLFSSSRLVADYPVKSPMIDIHVIGAGGGSIAWMDDAGALKVGPKSAGADPGPAAYLRGGGEATITDAQICLQRLNPVALLNGRLQVDAAAARKVINDKVARPLGLTLEQAAEGVIRIANANMSRAIRSVSTERGYDLSQFALFAYGGAGPLHAIDVAAECGISTVIVPQEPGTLCARGMLLTDVSFDFVRSEIAAVNADTWQRVCRIFADMQAQAQTWLERERASADKQSFRCHIDARYEGQNFEVIVGMPQITADGMQEFLMRFADAHQREYGYQVPQRQVEIVNCRLQAVGAVARAPLRGLDVQGTVQTALVARRRIFFGTAHEWLDTPVYSRAKLPAGVALVGPAVIEEMSSTILLPRGQTAAVDRIGNILINLNH